MISCQMGQSEKRRQRMRRKLRTLRDMYSTGAVRLIVSSFVVASMVLLTVANVVNKVMWLKIVFFD